MKIQIALACLMTSTAFAQSSKCIQMRANTSNLEVKPVTCLDTKELERSLNQLAADETARNITYSAIGEMPGGSMLTTTLEEIKKHSGFENYLETNAKDQLEAVLSKYTDSIYFETNSNNPSAHLEVVKASIEYSTELNKLLDLKNLLPEHRDKITKTIHKINMLGDLMSAKLESDIGKANKVAQQKINAEMTTLKNTVKELLLKNDPSKLIGAVTELSSKLEELNSRIKDLETNVTTANAVALESFKKERAQIEAALQIKTQQTIQQIQDYSRFAQGMVAIYSIFDAEEASRIGNAVSGLTNMAIGYASLASIGASATAGAAFGPYGMIAMGAVQVFNSFSQQSGSNSAFKAIFKQLQMISKQITELQKRMDTRFDRMEESLFRVEKNILERLDVISEQIQDVDAMMRYSISTINDIDRNIKGLSNYVVSQDIQNYIKDDYLSVLERCLGQKNISVKLNKNGITQCLNDLEKWFDNYVTSDIMTKKMLNGQYAYRNQFDWQIQDITDYYRTASSGVIDYQLANPALLKDLSDSLQFLKYNNIKSFNRSHNEHSIFEKVRSEEEKVRNFVTAIQKDESTVNKMKNEYAYHLKNVHAKTRIKMSESNDNVLDHHKQEMALFKSMLKNQIVSRGNPTAEEEQLTLNSIKEFAASAEAVKYNESPRQLIDNKNVVLFARNCSEASEYNVLIPINYNYLEKTLGAALTKRFILNPKASKICYNLELERNKLLYSASGMIRNERVKELKKALESQIGKADFDTHMIMRGGGSYGPTNKSIFKASGTYQGEFLKSLTIFGSFGSTKVLQDTFQINEKIPMIKNASDQFALLTLLKGGRYNRSVNLPKIWSLDYNKEYVAFNDSALPASAKVLNLAEEMKTSAGGLLMPNASFSTPANVANLRNDVKSLNHEEIYNKEVNNLNISIVEKIADELEKTNTDKLDEAGKMLAAAMYFKGDASSNELLKSSLSEVWGLKSGKFLKNHYLDVLSVDASTASLDFILEDQMKHLEAIR